MTTSAKYTSASQNTIRSEKAVVRFVRCALEPLILFANESYLTVLHAHHVVVVSWVKISSAIRYTPYPVRSLVNSTTPPPMQYIYTDSFDLP